MTIDHVDLNRIDLNLLVALDALLSERSVTRAAGKIGIGQPAMSAALRRLRKLFGDELLTRGPEGMRPTPRALSLARKVHLALQQIESIVRYGESFEARHSKRIFTVALPDSTEVLIMPRVLARLRKEAPGIRLVLRPFERQGFMDDLDTDAIDIGIGYLLAGQVHHKRRVLYKDDFLCLYNAELLGIDTPISLEDFVRFPHVLTSLGGATRGIVDDALAKIGMERSIVLRAQRFLAVPYIVKDAPVMTTMVAKLARRFAGSLGLTVSPPPFDLEDVATSMVWHTSYDDDPGHAWLRDLLLRTCRDL